MNFDQVHLCTSLRASTVDLGALSLSRGSVHGKGPCTFLPHDDLASSEAGHAASGKVISAEEKEKERKGKVRVKVDADGSTHWVEAKRVYKLVQVQGIEKMVDDGDGGIEKISPMRR